MQPPARVSLPTLTPQAPAAVSRYLLLGICATYHHPEGVSGMSAYPGEEERDEVEEVLAVLRGLMQRMTSPVVRACLEDACTSIAHLAGSSAEPEGPRAVA